MERRVLVACDCIPGCGGAATAAYQMFRKLQENGVDVAHVNIIDQRDAGYFQYTFGANPGNPDSLSNVHNCWLTDPIFHAAKHTRLADIVARVNPDVIIGVDFIAAHLLKRVAPEIPVVLLTAGCSQLMRLIERGLTRNVVSYQAGTAAKIKPPIKHVTEADTVREVDLVVTHSDMIRDLYCHFFAKERGKIHPNVVWYAEWICDEARRHAQFARPFSERDIDVLFVANRWDRPEKNWRLVKAIMRKLGRCSVHLVGDAADVPASVEHHGFINRREDLFSLLGRTKVVVSASRVDAAPGILFEASILGANVVASRNCGNWELCHDSLLANRYRASDFVRCINAGLPQKRSDHMDRFLGQRSYDELVETIAAV